MNVAFSLYAHEFTSTQKPFEKTELRANMVQETKTGQHSLTKHLT